MADAMAVAMATIEEIVAEVNRRAGGMADRGTAGPGLDSFRQTGSP
jgi:hypothetical protein